jgi:hypothetical protein
MARQAGVLKISGTIAGICFYQLEGEYYARRKSSLGGKRVKQDPVFIETMRYANLLGKASVIGSTVYRCFSKERKSRIFYRKITVRAMKMLKEGWSEELIMSRLRFVFNPGVGLHTNSTYQNKRPVINTDSSKGICKENIFFRHESSHIKISEPMSGPAEAISKKNLTARLGDK